jgi:hypothetical protein
LIYTYCQSIYLHCFSSHLCWSNSLYVHISEQGLLLGRCILGFPSCSSLLFFERSQELQEVFYRLRRCLNVQQKARPIQFNGIRKLSGPLDYFPVFNPDRRRVIEQLIEGHCCFHVAFSNLVRVPPTMQVSAGLKMPTPSCSRPCCIRFARACTRGSIGKL